MRKRNSSSQSSEWKAAAGLVLAVAVLTGTLFIAGCGLFKKEPPATAIAVVGEEWITRADAVRAITGLGLDPTEEANIARYVNQWVDRELLLHEARQTGLENDPVLRERLEQLEEELLVAELFHQRTEIDTPSARQVVEYWKNHTGEYNRVNDEVSIIVARGPDQGSAWEIRNGFDQALSTFQLREETGMTRLDTLYGVEIDRLPQTIVSGLSSLRTGHSTMPIQFHDEWVVVKLLERLPAGRTRPLEELEPQIRSRMVAEMQTVRRLEFIETLRREARQSGLVRIRYPMPSDTTAER